MIPQQKHRTYGDKILERVSINIIIVAITLVSLFGLGAVAISALLLLSYVGILSWPQRPSLDTLLTFFALATTIFLTATWIMASFGSIKLNEGATKLIGRVLVASILASVAGATAMILKVN